MRARHTKDFFIKPQHFDVIVDITQPVKLFIIFHLVTAVLDIIRTIHSKFRGWRPVAHRNAKITKNSDVQRASDLLILQPKALFEN